jgi:hypothetical protein
MTGKENPRIRAARVSEEGRSKDHPSKRKSPPSRAAKTARSARRAFTYQRYGAERRGIGFRFSYSAWLNWWRDNLGPNWLEKRGRLFGYYVMGRRRAEGPFSPKNAICLTASQNHRLWACRQWECLTPAQRLKRLRKASAARERMAKLMEARKHARTS